MPAIDLLRSVVRPIFFALILAAACATAPAPMAPAAPVEAPIAKPPPPVDICKELPAESTAQVAHIPAGAMEEAAPTLRLPEDARPTQEALSVTIDPTQSRFSGVAAIALQLDKPRSAIWLHGRGLHVTEAHLDLQGVRLPVQYEQVNDNGLVRAKIPCLVSGRALLSITWDAPFDPHLSGLYIAHEKNIPYAYTQFEAIDARRAFPGFDDPSFKIPWDVELVVPADDVAISNSSISNEGPSENGMHRVRFNTTPPLPAYLVAFAVGPFDVVSAPVMPPSAVRDHPLQIRGIAPKGRGPELAFAMEASTALMTRLEDYFGIAFPYEKLDQIAVPDFQAGAMENAGAITYRESSLLYRPGVSAVREQEQIALTMAHEMAHQWFGDLVTLRWWTDTWLNESFAAWMENKMVEAWRPDLRGAMHAFEAPHRAMAQDATSTPRAIRKPVDDESQIWSQFDNLTYSKGAGLLAMMESWAGREPFRLGIQSYLKSHANSGGSSEELFEALSKSTGRDIAGPMHSFLDQAGIPLIKVKLVCNGKVRLELEQSRALAVGAKETPEMKAQLWQIPVCARAGVRGEIRSACTLLTTKTGELDLNGTRCPDWVTPDAGGLGYYRYALDPNDLKALVKARAQLSETERASLTSNLAAAYDQGTLPADEVIQGLAGFVHDREPAISGELIGILDGADYTTLAPKLKPELHAYGRMLYGPIAARLGWTPAPNEDPATAALRREVLSFLALTAFDPGVRSEGLKLGRAYANLDGDTFAPGVVSPELAGLALDILVQEGGAPVRQKLIARLANSDDASVRRRILAALGSSRDPAATAELLKLTFDPQLHKNERGLLVFSQMHHPETRAQASIWLSAHWDALDTELGDESMSRYVGLVASLACNRDDIAAAEAFLKPRLEKLPAAKLSYEQGMESAHLCIALRESQGKSLDGFFSKRIKDAPKR